jgi:hypothetical protein
MLPYTTIGGPCGHQIPHGDIPCVCNGPIDAQCPPQGRWENIGCPFCNMISGSHVARPEPGQILAFNEREMRKPCSGKCILSKGHSGEHIRRASCHLESCYLSAKHDGPHEQLKVRRIERLEVPTLKTLARKQNEESKEEAETYWLMNFTVLLSIEKSGYNGQAIEPTEKRRLLRRGLEAFTSSLPPSRTPPKKLRLLLLELEAFIFSKSPSHAPSHPRAGLVTFELTSPTLDKAMLSPREVKLREEMRRFIARGNSRISPHAPTNIHGYRASKKMQDSVYSGLNYSCREIRIFELQPRADGVNIHGSFRVVQLPQPLPYIALSYAWGDQKAFRSIIISKNRTIRVGKNLWDFLYQESSTCTKTKLFWIDALCINQSDIHERNHQVNLMKEIYTQASEVYVWLGDKSENSDIAMDYIANKGEEDLKPRGDGFYSFWTKYESQALAALFERAYWVRTLMT